MTSRYDRIYGILETVFNPTLVEIVDESAKHASHVKRTGVAAGGETHYNLVVVSEVFAGMSRLARSRAVHAALGRRVQGLACMPCRLPYARRPKTVPRLKNNVVRLKNRGTH